MSPSKPTLCIDPRSNKYRVFEALLVNAFWQKMLLMMMCSPEKRMKKISLAFVNRHF